MILRIASLASLSRQLIWGLVCGSAGASVQQLISLLSPHVDKLFDRHLISFDSDGQLIWQHEAAGDALRCWGIEGANVVQPFSRKQEQFLRLHRECLR